VETHRSELWHHLRSGERLELRSEYSSSSLTVQRNGDDTPASNLECSGKILLKIEEIGIGRMGDATIDATPSRNKGQAFVDSNFKESANPITPRPSDCARPSRTDGEDVPT